MAGIYTVHSIRSLRAVRFRKLHDWYSILAYGKHLFFLQLETHWKYQAWYSIGILLGFYLLMRNVEESPGIPYQLGLVHEGELEQGQAVRPHRTLEGALGMPGGGITEKKNITKETASRKRFNEKKPRNIFSRTTSSALPSRHSANSVSILFLKHRKICRQKKSWGRTWRIYKSSLYSGSPLSLNRFAFSVSSSLSNLPPRCRRCVHRRRLHMYGSNYYYRSDEPAYISNRFVFRLSL